MPPSVALTTALPLELLAECLLPMHPCILGEPADLQPPCSSTSMLPSQPLWRRCPPIWGCAATAMLYAPKTNVNPIFNIHSPSMSPHRAGLTLAVNSMLPSYSAVSTEEG